MMLEAVKFDLLTRPLSVVVDFFEKVLKDLPLDGNPQVIMDIGCGPGRHTQTFILPFFRSLKKLIAIDPVVEAIEHARANYSHPNIEYHVADIEDWESVSKWEGQVTHCVSNFVFHWLRDQKKGFRNVYKLLKPEGWAAILTPLHTELFEVMGKTLKDSKWERYFEGIFDMAEYSCNKYDGHYFKKLVKEEGFHILHFSEEFTAEAYPSDQIYKSFFCALIPVHCIPAEQRDEFEEEFFQQLVHAMGRNEEGLPLYSGNHLKLVIQKPKLS